ncbi:MAG TPA: ferritin [Clostridiales bacterium]|nr:ferritin [Clostridiales bacterium]
MLRENLMAELNTQIQFEIFSENLYLAMAAYCADQDLDGFANFFKVQAEEEKSHAMKIFDYIIERDGRARISAIDEPQNDFASVLDAFQKAYEHEQSVTERFNKLMDLAMEEKDHATANFLKWFVDEQVEEESLFRGIIAKLKRIGDNGAALHMLDNELAQRKAE